MSKAVHWTIPFQSVKGINYEIRIYDDYTGSVPAAWPVILQAGETPITTQEDASDDFFTPVRPSTGTISVIDTDGTLMEQLLPANNIARPVRLIKKGATAAQDTIEWQGFLSCEAYQQDYTSVAQELQLSIISVLEAMDSVQLDSSYAGMKLAGNVIYTIISKMTTDAGIGSLYDRVYYSGEAWRFMNKYIDTSVFFEEKEYNNENSTTYIVDSISLKEVLDRICKFMGWVARENGTYLYLAREEEKYGMWYSTPAQLETAISPSHHVNTQQQNMSALTYRGEAHTKSTTQGAKSVGVDAKIEKYSLSEKLPECPNSDLNDKTVRVITGAGYGAYTDVTTKMSATDDFNSKCTFQCLKTIFDRQNPQSIQFVSMDTIANGISKYPWNPPQYPANILLYSCMAKIEDRDFENALIIISSDLSLFGGTKFDRTETNYLFSIKNYKHVCLSNGKLIVKVVNETAKLSGGGTLPTALRFGTKWWNGTQWSDSFCTFMMSNTDDGLQISIGSAMSGDIELQLHYDINTRLWDGEIGDYYENSNAIISSIDISFKLDEDSNKYKNDRSSNKYFQLLSTNFSDEISIGTDLATDLNNIPSPTILQDTSDGQTPTTSISYQTGASTNDDRRPEKDLLSRLAKYYSRVRRKVELEVEHPTAAALPLLTINGYDGKKYLPLAEERDWQQDTSKLTCMETPDGDS